RVATRLRRDGLIWQAQCYPKTVADLAPVLDLVGELGADHVNLQPDIRPHRIEDCIPLLEGWRRLAERAGIAVHV
ncbi:MAG: sugar phosphate isomerase/epimerase, partial [Rhodospirillales bacterium]|nr:sugar phosphate isomerase/epimerase [Rhodospirillales bacterium]